MLIILGWLLTVSMLFLPLAFVFSPSCSCCGGTTCTACSGDTGPENFSIVVDGVASIPAWDQCTNANGTFALPFFSDNADVSLFAFGSCSFPGAKCEWRSATFDLDSSEPLAQNYYYRLVVVKCSSSLWYVAVQLQRGGVSLGAAQWQNTYTSAPACTSLSSESLTQVSGSALEGCDLAGITCVVSAT